MTISRSIPSSRAAAFTIVELLVVVSIITLLVAMLLPAMRLARAQAQRTTCQSNLRQSGAAMNNHPQDHDGLLPGPSWYGQTPKYNSGTKDLARWLAPYLGLPPAASQTKINPYFICPAMQHVTPAGLQIEDLVIYGAMSEKSPVTNLRVFGYPEFNGAPEYGPSPFTLVRSPSTAKAVRDIDYPLDYTAGWSANTTFLPSHGYANGIAQRNYLFFDGHVEGIAEEQVFRDQPN